MRNFEHKVYNLQESLINQAVGLVLVCYEDIQDDALKIEIAIELYFYLLNFRQTSSSRLGPDIENAVVQNLASRCFIEAYENGVLN